MYTQMHLYQNKEKIFLSQSLFLQLVRWSWLRLCSSTSHFILPLALASTLAIHGYLTGVMTQTFIPKQSRSLAILPVLGIAFHCLSSQDIGVLRDAPKDMIHSSFPYHYIAATQLPLDCQIR